MENDLLLNCSVLVLKKWRKSEKACQLSISLSSGETLHASYLCREYAVDCLSCLQSSIA